MGKRGSILIEGVVTLFPVLLFMAWGLDSFRTELFKTVLHHSVFQHVRARALGSSSDESEAKVNRYLTRVLGNSLGNYVGSGMSLKAQFKKSGWIGHVYFRYPQFLRFDWKAGSKHHMEVTERCSFPY